MKIYRNEQDWLELRSEVHCMLARYFRATDEATQRTNIHRPKNWGGYNFLKWCHGTPLPCQAYLEEIPIIWLANVQIAKDRNPYLPIYL